MMILTYNTNLYKSNWVNVKPFLDDGQEITIMLGGRGIGKTYGVIEYLHNMNKPFIYTRRKQSILDSAIQDAKLNPFNKFNSNTGNYYHFRKSSKYTSDILNNEEDRGIALALSTISNVRGISAEIYDYWLNDEMIPQLGERNENDTDFNNYINAYETINRNKEIEGGNATRIIHTGNSDNLENALLREYKLQDVVLKMKRKKYNLFIDESRHIMLLLYDDSPISKMKANTAIYQSISKDSKIYGVNIRNEFADLESDNIRSKDLRHYRPLCAIGKVNVYISKSGSRYYISPHSSGKYYRYSDNEIGLSQFRRRYCDVYESYFEDRVDFENYEMKAEFKKLFTNKR